MDLHFLTLSLAALCGLAFAYYFVLSLPPGLPRLLALSPLLPIYLLLPWHAPSYQLRAVSSLVFLWSSPSKLLLLCWDTGIDSYPWIISTFPHFLVANLLPVIVTGPKSPAHSMGDSALHNSPSILGHFAGLIVLLNLYSFRDLIPDSLICAMYCLHLYLGLQVVLGGLAKLVSTSFNVEVQSPFDNIFQSSNLSEFWGRRWNLTVISILRATVYKPVINGLVSGGKGEPSSKSNLSWVSALATLATFTVSALMHELIFFYITRHEVTWEVTAFFVLHGMVTIVEKAARRGLLSHRLKVPPAFCVLFTLSFLYITTRKFFLPPLRSSQADLRTIAEYHEFQNWLVGFRVID